MSNLGNIESKNILFESKNTDNINLENQTKISHLPTNYSFNDSKNNENGSIYNPQTDRSCSYSIYFVENKNKNSLIFQSHTIGRKRTKNKSKNKLFKKPKRKKGSRHNELDNIRSNIKNKLFNFIIDFFNVIIVKMCLVTNGNKFLRINSEDKKQITKAQLNKQLKLLMKDILKLKISKDYKNFKRSNNKDLYDIIENQIDEKYQYLFDMRLYEFYEKFFLIEDINELNKEFGYFNEKFPLKNVILHLRRNEEKYKNRYKDTAYKLLSFANINISLNNKNHDEQIIKSENPSDHVSEDTEFIYKISSNSQSSFHGDF